MSIRKNFDEGAAEVVSLLEQILAWNNEDAELKKHEERAKQLRADRAVTAEKLVKLLADMDLQSPGNYGYEQRLLIFLAEMRRHVEGVAKLSPHDRVVLDRAMAENARLKEQVARCERYGLLRPELKGVEFCSKNGARIVGELLERHQRELESHAILAKRLQDESAEKYRVAENMRADMQTLTAERDQLKFKLDELSKQHVKLEGERDELRRQLTAVKTDRDNVWLWKGGVEENNPESLVCPIVMTPDTLKALLNTHLVNAVERVRKYAHSGVTVQAILAGVIEE